MTLWSVITNTRIWRALIPPPRVPDAEPYTAPRSLTPLGPRYEPAQHQDYVAYLQAAMTGPSSGVVRNIALTGAYGTGKSSILQALIASVPDRSVHISLSALDVKVEKELEKSSDAGDSDSKAVSTGTTRISTTNVIQKEIVKQLLYSTSPSDLPGSRYRRIARFDSPRTLGLAIVIGLSISALIGIFGWSSLLSAAWRNNWVAGLMLYGLVFLFLAAVAFVALRHAHNRWTLERVGTASTTIALTGAASSYFDAYLDEIVHFFDQTERDVVVFEDLDRFADTSIFETLRALNTLVNTAVRRGNRPIRFIYAVRDSIFSDSADEGGWIKMAPQFADANAVQISERTKFFDLIVPVVPFITHQNGRDLLERELRGHSPAVDPALIRLIGRYVTDMRQVRNISNEYAVFANRVLRDDGLRDLRPEGLLAMMAFKNTHLSEFEKVQSGTSSLDALYERTSLYRAQAVNDAEKVVESLQDELRRIPGDESAAEARGDALGEEIDQLLALIGESRCSLTFDGAPVARDALRSPEFWSRVDAAPTASLVVSSAYNEQEFRLSVEEIRLRLDRRGIPLVADAKQRVSSALTEAVRARSQVRFASIAELLGIDPAIERENDVAETFSVYVKRIFPHSLSHELIVQGYLDENFTLYVSDFHGVSVSARVMNFIVHTVQRDGFEPDYAFDDPDLSPRADGVTTLLREVNVESMSDRSLLNVAVFDHVFDPHADGPHLDEARRRGARRVALAGDDELAFLERYLTVGRQRESLLYAISGLWPGVFNFLARDVDVATEDLRVRFVDAALRGAEPGVQYATSLEVRELIEANAPGLGALTGDAIGEHLGEILRTLSVKLIELQPLGQTPRTSVINRRAYRMSASNLLTAAGQPESIALDQLWNADAVREYILDELDEYLEIVAALDGQHTIDDPSRFELSLAGLLPIDHALQERVIALASPACIVSSLADVDSEFWPVLARQGRMTASHENVVSYIGHFGVDTHLAKFLSSTERLSAAEGIPPTEREAIALQLVNAGNVDPERLASILTTYLDEPLQVAQVTTNDGATIMHLVRAGLLGTDRTVADELHRRGWKPIEGFLEGANPAPEYVGEMRWTAAEIENLAESSTLSPSILDQVARNLGAQEWEITSYSAPLLARHATDRQLRLDGPSIAALSTGGIEPWMVVELAGASVDQLPLPELYEILRGLGGDYLRATEYGPGIVHWPKSDASKRILDRLAVDGPVSQVFDDDVDSWRASRKHSPH